MAASEQRHRGPAHRPIRVMVIENDTSRRASIAEALGAERMEVDGLANAEDGLILLAAGQVPDVLVANASQGPALAAAANDLRRPLRLIVVSGEIAEGNAPEGRLFREQVLRMPVPPEALAGSIRELLPAASEGTATDPDRRPYA